MGGSATAPGPHIQLTPNATGQAGRVWYTTAQNVTACGAFVVDFDYQIIPPTGAPNPGNTADGMSFWLVDPLTGFVGGGGIGLPTNPNGLVLVFDTYDNGTPGDDPLISLYGYPAGFVGAYTESDPTNRLAAMPNQTSLLYDGAWHHVKLTYAGGNIRVYFDYNVLPSMTVYFPILTAGYFGFTASTGAVTSTHNVRNVYINSNSISPIVGPGVLCLGGSAVTFTDSTAGGTWSSTNAAVGTINSSTGVFTPIGAGTTTVSYIYSSSCNTARVITVNAASLPLIAGPTPLCSSSVGAYSNTTTGGTWTSSNTAVGTVNPSTGELTPVQAGELTLTYTLPAGCYTTKAVTINTAPPTLSINPLPASVCNNGSLTLTATPAGTYNLFPPQSWESGTPTTAGYPVNLWTYSGTIASVWTQQDAALTTSPAVGAASAGTYVAKFNCRGTPTGTIANIHSPSFSMVGVGTGTLTFWMYRDGGAAYTAAAYATEGLTVLVNTTASPAGATNLGFIPRRAALAITGPLTGPSAPGGSGWYQYTVTIPAAFTGTANYIIFQGTSRNGNNFYVDDVRLTGTVGAPTWAPSTYLFNDAAFATAYTGAALNPVYMHPTGISSPTPITYTVSLTNGLCSGTGTGTATANPNPAAITGTGVICLASTTTLSSTPAAGVWTSGNTTVATVGAGTGVVTGAGVGTAVISYSFGGCYSTTVVTVVSSPGTIAGSSVVCLGSTVTFTNPVGGGTWSSSNPAVGSVGSSTGVVGGVSTGTTIITYGIGTCYSTMTVSVNVVPTAIAGSLGVCVGATTALSSTPTGGFWFSGTTSVATITPLAGVATGVAPGTSVITYTRSGCSVNATLNVVSSPPPITGTLATCYGSTTTLANATPGGTWTSGNTAVATVGSNTGVVSGVGIAGGTATITYSVSAGCFTTAVVTVGAAPPAPTGTMSVCVGATTTLNHVTPSGTWTGSCPGVASISLTGVVTGVGPGTCVVTYTLPVTGCVTTATVTVSAVPGPITGTLSVCVGSTTTLGNSAPGGSWSMSCPGIATIGSSSGIVTGVGSGTCTVTYTLGSGCFTTAVVTVNSVPGAISGTFVLCSGTTTTYSTTGSPILWGNTTTTTGAIGGTGVYTATASGNDTVIASNVAGCSVRAVVTVNASPSAIAGPLGICVGATTTLSATPAGGTWTVTAPGTMSVPGVVGGSAPGTATVSYTVNGCSSSAVVTINSLPGTIGGPLSVCIGQCNTLTNSAGGGTWASGNTSVATIGTSSGSLCGIAAGTSIITYSLGSTGCSTTAIATVNGLPSAIGGTLSVCAGSITTVTATPAGGTWSMACPTIGTINSSTGVWTGIAAGTCEVTYTLSTGCRSFAVVTVNALPTSILGSTAVCAGACTTLTGAPLGGTWVSNNATVGTIGTSSGIFCGAVAGTATVTYTLPTTCYRTEVIQVNPLPTSITGATSVCENQCGTLTGNPLGGAWSSSTPAVGTIGAGSGLLCGIAAGTTNITYTLPTTCTLAIVATVNPLPAPITGTMSMCVGSSTTLNSTPPVAGSTWSANSTPAGNVTIGATTGVVNGINAGTATVSYTHPTGCRATAVVTVLALPSAISGTLSVCETFTTTLNCTPGGGTWSTTCPGIASIGTNGVVTGLSAGTCDVTYTLGSGCIRTAVITVNALPAAISGVPTTCVGSTTTLTSTPGAVWSSSNPSIATVGSSSGVVTGVSGPLTVTIISTIPTTGCYVTQVVTVYALPANIAGPTQVCDGLSITLSAPGTPGGSWSSSNTGVAVVNGTTGVVTGQPVLVPSTATITYTLGTGCLKTYIITVNPLPANITGTLEVCEAGGTTLLANTTGGGTWTSSNTGRATVNSSGLVTGVVAGGVTGTANISYTITGTGCYKTATVTVNQLPATFSGPSVVCVNESITLSTTPAGGTWSSGSSTVTVGSSSGVVTGSSDGTALITYTAPVTGCVRTGQITVNALPANITGTLAVCEGQCATLTNASGGGSWSSSNPAVGTISSGGTICGTIPGTTTISYTFTTTGCRITSVFTVNQLPTPITGSDGFCNYSYSNYTSLPGGGVWTSSDTSILQFADSLVGTAYGKAVDTATMTYTLPTGCSASKSVYMILAPYTVDGPDSVCHGSCVTVSNIIGGGVWSTSNAGVLSITPVTSTTGTACGVTPGTATITYVLSTGCYSDKTIVVNPIPAGVTGSLQVCEGLTTDLDNVTPGGTWYSFDPTVATIDPATGVATGVTGAIPGDTTTITYALSSGCSATVLLTVHALPAAITGIPQVCEGMTTTLFSAPSTGTWMSTDPAVASITSTGIVSGLSSTAPGVNGPGRTRITYTLPTGCLRTQDVTVNGLPADITGISNICVGDVTLLANGTPGGSWLSSNTGVATVDPIGVVTGVSGGSVIITYMLSTGCLKTWPMTVNDNPAPIGGSLTVCAGFATNLTSGPSGGTWSSDPASNPYGTINPGTGVVSAISAGTIPVTYSIGSGCRTTATVTVVNLPAMISGYPRVCAGGGIINLSHSTPGGTWSISNPAIATVDMSGQVTGIAAGTTVVTYTVGTGCFNILTVTVNPLPAPITGPDSVCVHSSITLMNSTPGGVWASDSTPRAYVVDVAGAGVVTGVSAGLAQIRYTVVTGGVGCYSTKMIRVDATPEPITGNPHICMGAAGYFTSISTGGVWNISNPAVATLAPTTTNTVIAVPVSLGSAIITYEFPGHGCRVTRSVTVQPLPVVYNVTGGGNFCAGGTGVPVGLDGSQPGVSYVLYNGSTAAGYLSGTGLPLNFGLQTASGIYTVQATNVTSGCQRDMAGSATVVATPLITPTVSINASPTDSVCTGETVILTPNTTTGGAAPTYVWKVNGVTVATGNTYSFVPADGDVATVVMTSNANCLAVTTATGNKTLTVLPMVLPVAGIITDPNDSVCQFTPVTFTAAPLYGGTAPAYAWRVNGIPVGTGPSYTFVPVNGSVVNYSLTSNYRCRLANTAVSNDVKMYVEPMVIPSVAIVAAPGLSVMTGKPITFTAVPYNAGPSPRYQWKVNGYPVTGATSDTYTGIFNDRDSIACEVISDGICSNIGTSGWVFVSITTSVRSQAGVQSDIRLLPNPNKGAFTIRGTLAGNEDMDVDVTNMLGQVVYKGTVQVKQGRVDAQVQLDKNLSNGMYILTLHTKDGQMSFHFVMEQ
ncbi:hypothetical protein GCM10023093_05580 [Nemorincola caseinilytica]|uniref:L-type lectin-like domain-containing protein n=1 Tax=Nemorincola caseinilytica TaxID=2054315 RepID=A0ABP8N4M4_9BACT